MRRKILKKISLLSLFSIPLVFMSCNNSKDSNDENNNIQTNTNSINNITTGDSIEITIDDKIARINDMDFETGLEYYAIPYGNDNNLNSIKRQIYYGLKASSCGGKFENNKFNENITPLVLQRTLDFSTTSEKKLEYYKSQTSLLNWDNNMFDFNQDVVFNIDCYTCAGKIMNVNLFDESYKKENLYTLTNKLGYFFSESFSLDNKNYIEDIINKNELSVDAEGFGYLFYQMEIKPLNDSYIKLGSLWEREDIYNIKTSYVYDSNTDSYIKKEEVEYVLKKGDVVNPSTKPGFYDKLIIPSGWLKYKIDDTINVLSQYLG